jgi:hypothetical protein
MTHGASGLTHGSNDATPGARGVIRGSCHVTRGASGLTRGSKAATPGSNDRLCGSTDVTQGARGVTRGSNDMTPRSDDVQLRSRSRRRGADAPIRLSSKASRLIDAEELMRSCVRLDSTSKQFHEGLIQLANLFRQYSWSRRGNGVPGNGAAWFAHHSSSAPVRQWEIRPNRRSPGGTCSLCL